MPKSRLGLAELAAEIVEVRGDSSQPRHAFQRGFVPQCLEFFGQCVLSARRSGIHRLWMRVSNSARLAS